MSPAQMILCALLALNLTAAILVAWDKRRAVRGGRRLPEKVFFLLAGLGACPGLYWAMRRWRHKTRRRRFMMGLPLLFVLQLCLLAAFYTRFAA